ncbi:MAG: histidine phosphatase [Caulobacteraceae bacterium]|nr:histidine phosphatase [Caulobacteraceae bacterium]
MHRLILIRHATAEPEGPGVDDFNRALTAHGRVEATRTGEALAAKGYQPDIALVSAATRARQTWEEVGPAFGRMVDTRLEPQLYETSPERILSLAQAQAAQTVVVVGHNPTFQHLAMQLLIRDAQSGAILERLRRSFPKGAALVFRFDPGPKGEARPSGTVHCEGLLP